MSSLKYPTVGVPKQLREAVDGKVSIRVADGVDPNSFIGVHQLGMHQDIKRKINGMGWYQKDAFKEKSLDEKEVLMNKMQTHIKTKKTKLFDHVREKIDECIESGDPIPLSAFAEKKFDKFLESDTGKTGAGTDLESDLSTVDGQVDLLEKLTRFELTEEDKKKKGGKVHIKFLDGNDMCGLSKTRVKNVAQQMNEYRTEERQTVARTRVELLKSLK
ncbi:predicted protein [Chaetoceros tenuissimus]|uniref:Uncharacterized protein n=1 Tax=Chaetoceros tenuissimus TaxID=426638 RepID=A0AAD3CQ57_9STRA|nr:predicted protein [Chaetoceros tenuissimus]